MRKRWLGATVLVLAISMAGVADQTTAGRARGKQAGNRASVIEKKTGDGREAAPAGELAEYGYAPRVTLSFPSTLFSGRETAGVMTWKDPDDKVVSVFLTVFFHDGDAATVTLFDTREGDIAASTGRITFGITPAGYDPPLGSNGFLIVTVTDQTLNITQMSASFLVR
ncbi:MAG: hypothetical protein AB1714_08415 [Acidobacteriota bacterium]